MATLLDAGANVVCADRNGCTALHKAGRSGVGSAVRLLLDAGADVAAVDKLRSTALHEAASAGRRGALTSLCKAGASTEARDSSGRAPLHIAAESGSAAVVIALLPFTLSPGAPGHDNGGGLHGAPAGQVPEGDVPESLGFGVNAVDHDGQTPVHFAAFNGHAEVVAMLLHHGAFPEVVNVMGLTPLSIAASLGHGGIVDQLGPAHPSGAVSTPLHGAVKYGRLALLAKPQLRPFLHAADEAGSTALHLAASAVDAPAVRILMGLNSKRAEAHERGHRAGWFRGFAAHSSRNGEHVYSEAALHISPALPKKSGLLAKSSPERGKRAKETSKEASRVRLTAEIRGQNASAL